MKSLEFGSSGLGVGVGPPIGFRGVKLGGAFRGPTLGFDIPDGGRDGGGGGVET